MKTLSLAEAETSFSSVIKEVVSGTEIAVSYGKREETVAVIVPYEKWKKSRVRQLGTLEGKMTAEFADEFEMTDEELISL
ncbi:MAG: type II toxin-antitoxin system Phd/YefM family antitoxin [Synergistaceae bacterium]|jgi:prevent-host-death family protein|nr:type II toxin-antitoxin system Phd/YefM family antitoxin [Synergistaceae bacterium]